MPWDKHLGQNNIPGFSRAYTTWARGQAAEQDWPGVWFGAVAVPRLLGPQGPGWILHQHHPFPPLHRVGFLIFFRSLSHPTLAQRGDGFMDQQSPAMATAVLAMSMARQELSPHPSILIPATFVLASTRTCPGTQ